MCEPPGECHLENGAGRILFQCRSHDVAGIPAHHENPGILWKPPQKGAGFVEVPGGLLHPTGVVSSPHELPPTPHQREQPRSRVTRLTKCMVKNALDFISRYGRAVPVKRRPKASPVEHARDRIRGPGPVEQVRLEGEHQQVRMPIEQRPQQTRAGSWVPDNEGCRPRAQGIHRSLNMRINTVVFRLSGSVPPRL